jgi:hypothetical protein
MRMGHSVNGHVDCHDKLLDAYQRIEHRSSVNKVRGLYAVWSYAGLTSSQFSKYVYSTLLFMVANTLKSQ